MVISGGSSGNLQQQIPRDEFYDFRFYRVPLAGGGFYTFHRMSANVGTFEKQLFLKGDFNGWSATDDFAYLGDDKYERIIEIDNPGTYSFKVPDAGWSAATNFGAAGNPQVGLETPIEAADASQTNFSLQITESGAYRFVFDVSGSVPLLTVTLEAPAIEDPGPYVVPLYVKGDMNGWQNTNIMQFKEPFYYAYIPLEARPAGIQFKIVDENWSTVNLGGSTNPQDFNVGEEITLVEDSNPGNLRLMLSESGIYEFKLNASNPDSPSLIVQQSTNAMVIHYWRSAADYTDWGLHLWSDGIDPKEIPTWSTPKAFNGLDSFGVYSVIRLVDPIMQMGFIIHKGDEKDHLGQDMAVTPSDVNNEIWMNQGSAVIYTSKAEAEANQ